MICYQAINVYYNHTDAAMDQCTKWRSIMWVIQVQFSLKPISLVRKSGN